MKRGRAVLGMVCAAVALAGCQPTTDEVIVTPKSGIAGARMMDETTAGNVAEQVQAPEKCSLEFQDEYDIIKVIVDADVTVPDAEGIRLKKTETHVFGQKDMDNLQADLLQGQSLWRRVYTPEQKETGYNITKREVEEIIKKCRENMKSADDEQRIIFEDELAYWLDVLEKVPESYGTEEASMEVVYDRGEAEKFYAEGMTGRNRNMVWGGVLLDGEDYNFQMDNNWTSDSRRVSATLVKGRYEHEGIWDIYTNDEGAQDVYGESLKEANGMADTFAEEAYDGAGSDDIAVSAEITERAAEQAEKESGWHLETPAAALREKGDAQVRALGFSDMEVAAYEKCRASYSAAFGYSYALNLIYARKVDGIPITYTDYRYGYPFEEQDYSEKLSLAYDDNGLVQMIWSNPSKIYDMSDEYVFLLPFSDILKIFQEKVAELHREGMAEEYDYVQKTLFIKDIRLGYMWVPDASTEMEGMLIPVWDFIGTYVGYWPENEALGIGEHWTVNNSPNQSFLTINAMDGTLARGGKWMN
ncbi:DUF6034 family protein [Lachnospiraceae bacterium 46-15]